MPATATTWNIKPEYAHGLSAADSDNTWLDVIVDYLTGAVGGAQAPCTIINDMRANPGDNSFVELQVGTSDVRLLLLAHPVGIPVDNVIDLGVTTANSIYAAIAKGVTINADPLTAGGPWKVGNRASATNMTRMVNTSSGSLNSFGFLSVIYSNEMLMLTIYGNIASGGVTMFAGNALLQLDGESDGLLATDPDGADPATWWNSSGSGVILRNLTSNLDTNPQILRPVPGVWLNNDPEGILIRNVSFKNTAAASQAQVFSEISLSKNDRDDVGVLRNIYAGKQSIGAGIVQDIGLTTIGYHQSLSHNTAYDSLYLLNS